MFRIFSVWFLMLFPWMLLLPGCKNTAHSGDHLWSGTVINAGSDKGFYSAGETVRLSYAFCNETAKVITPKNITIEIKDISKAKEPRVFEKSLEYEITLQPGGEFQRSAVAVWKIPPGNSPAVYGIYMTYELEGIHKLSKYMSFFRVVADSALTTYKIEQTQYKGIDVFLLHGGMSAECVVEKAAENLKPGIAHSWYLNAPGSGPEPVLATPRFLQNSVRETVDFYNRTLGNETAFETVIIGPGLETIPYLSQALKAPVLPIHFLASAGSVKEIQSILDFSNQHGYVSYATLGHDFSVPLAVAWVKLLEMPDEYLQFIKQHRVKNLVFAGYTGGEGENTARKVSNGATRSLYEPGSLFILYPGGGSESDIQELENKIIDLDKTVQQEGFVRIADWESGITRGQIHQYMKKAREQAGITAARFITTKDMIHLWDLATYVSAAFFHKNEKVIASVNGLPVKGVSVNPYFSVNAFFEAYNGYVPLIYWQHTPVEKTVARIKNVSAAILSAYFPSVSITDLTCWINSSNNFDGAKNAKELKSLVRRLGFNGLVENDYTQDDIWNESDGMRAPVEVKAAQLANAVKSAAELKAWNDSLTPLSLEDIDAIGEKFPVILISKLQ